MCNSEGIFILLIYFQNRLRILCRGYLGYQWLWRGLNVYGDNEGITNDEMIGIVNLERNEGIVNII